MNKAVLHDHLDGGLRATTALELAKNASYAPLLEIDLAKEKTVVGQLRWLFHHCP